MVDFKVKIEHDVSSLHLHAGFRPGNGVIVMDETRGWTQPSGDTGD